MPYTRARRATRRPMRAARRPRIARRRRTYAKKMLRRPRLTKNLGTVIPNRALCKFKAADTWTPATSVAGGFASFYANNPYDPVIGVSTTSCSGFEQLLDIYKWGICYACKVKVKAMIQTVNSLVYIYWTDSTMSLPVAAPSTDRVMELGQNIAWKHKAVYQYNETPGYLKSYKSMKALEKRKELEPDDYLFTSSAGPARANGVQVGYIPADSGSAITYLCPLFVRLTYYCKLFERQEDLAT